MVGRTAVIHSGTQTLPWLPSVAPPGTRRASNSKAAILGGEIRLDTSHNNDISALDINPSNWIMFSIAAAHLPSRPFQRLDQPHVDCGTVLPLWPAIGQPSKLLWSSLSKARREIVISSIAG